MYSIGQVSKLFNLPISTLRYYEKEGLLPNVKRKSGIRLFDDQNLEAIRVIECLKKSGLEICDIRAFMEMVAKGSKTYTERKALFEKRRECVTEEIQKLQRTLAMIEFKCWYYDTAIKDGNEDGINSMLPNNLPDDIQKLYDICHDKDGNEI